MHSLNRSRRARRAKRGFTLLELAISGAVLAMVLGAVGLIIARSEGTCREGLAVNAADAKARRLVEHIAQELIQADRSTLVQLPAAPFGGTSIDFAPVTGVAAGELVLGPLRQIRLRLAPGELDDGLDNDGNGLIDEGRIELVPDVVGAPTAAVDWGGYVREYLEGELPNNLDDNGNGIADERGLCLTYEPTTGIATVRVSIERLDSMRRPMVSTVETSVQVRND